MNKITTLPKMETTFTIQVTGVETKQLYEGKFTYKRLNLGQRIESSKMEARLAGDLMSLPGDVNKFIEMVSHLKYGLIDWPDWWANNGYGLDLYDTNVVTAVYNQIQEFEAKWDKEVYGKSEDKDKDKKEDKKE